VEEDSARNHSLEKEVDELITSMTRLSTDIDRLRQSNVPSRFTLAQEKI
jgi:hypothetical protein